MLKKSITFITFIGLSMTLCGCVTLVAGAIGGAGTAIWLSGKLTQEFNAPSDRAIHATHQALESLKLPITKETTNKDITQIMSKYTDGKTIWIDIKSTSQTTCRIEIRVGATGTKEAESKILTQISGNM
jgi:predicted phage tail protein